MKHSSILQVVSQVNDHNMGQTPLIGDKFINILEKVVLQPNVDKVNYDEPQTDFYCVVLTLRGNNL